MRYLVIALLVLALAACGGSLTEGTSGGGGYTPLHRAIADGLQEETLQLIKEGASVNTLTDRGNSPLHFAVGMGSVIIVQALLEAGANPNAKDHYLQTPLHFAAFAKLDKVSRMRGDASTRKEIAVLLVEAGASVDPTSSDGLTPLHNSGWSFSPELVSYLVEMGADLEANSSGATPLHLAVTRPEMIQPQIHEAYDDIGVSRRVISKLLELGSEVNVESTNGGSPLRTAVFSGEYYIVELLLDAGANVNATSPTGQTALHMAARSAYRGVESHEAYRMYKLLVSRGGDRCLRDKNGTSPAEAVEHYGLVLKSPPCS